ncbi:MAG: DNA repair protein RecN [Chloroherpetonaceae bacterium]|nr:DNA repair protein RecN [Chthonomonadaceae bacterium]MDW8207410.1 DNA repair protein RecN [Chloroherpetonaceae bacterium]
MLRHLSVRNFAIIDRLDLEFAPGFNVLTGETGAGKSILIDALNLILGARAGAEMVRAGTERAVVDAVFDVSCSEALQRRVHEMGFELEEGALLLSREVHAGGRSTCRIGGRPATVAQLREIGEWLVDLHGQHEHQSLLMVHRHLDILDEWGGQEVQALRASVAEAFQQVQRLRREKEELERDARERAHLLDLYAFQVREIQAARLTVGEEEELLAEHRRAANAHRLVTAATAAAQAIDGDTNGGALELLSGALRALEEVAELDPALQVSLDGVRNAVYELTEVSRDLARYADSVELNPERLTEIEERLEVLRTLKRKYGNSIEEILQYEQEAMKKRDALAHSEERGAQLETQIAQAEEQLRTLCAELSRQRHNAAEAFQQITLSELRDLAMEKAHFAVHFEAGEPTTRGVDRVEFLITTNPGEPLRPLAKVASGGEISRVMLAIKSALARQEPLPTMVFDEVDVGVGGRTASVIADKIAALARSAQVICITHLAQIASRASKHFHIEKRVEGERTNVSVTVLEEEQRVQEIARMIGGYDITPTVLQNAREMLQIG